MKYLSSFFKWLRKTKHPSNIKAQVQFNKRGHLTKTQSISFNEFEDLFVKDNFYKRPIIFDEFKEYLLEFSNITKQNILYVWVNGSFVTDEIEPKDIDFVIFVRETIPNFSEKITAFTNRFEYIDVYFIPLDDDDETLKYWIDYWQYSFSHSAIGMHKKGFLMLKLNVENGLIIDY